MSTCNSAPFSYNVNYYYTAQCDTCSDDCGNNVQDAKCTAYTGPNLPCSGIETNDSLEVALQKIDEQICSITGDFSTYQYNCLVAWWEEAITTESEFVDAITAYACEIAANIESFTGVSFPAYQSSVDARFDDIEGPGINCTAAGVISTDSLKTILNKYCTFISGLEDDISIAGVDWDQCLTVVTPPTTIAEAFSLLVDQICQVKATAGALPTFNNTGSCLSGGGATDSLSTTIGLIKTRLCLSPTWDSDNVTWGCVTAPVDDTDLEEAIQNIVTGVNTALQALPTFDGSDFVVTATNPMDPCAGVTISLATPINQDRFVASNVADATPGTLEDKLTAGTGISLDFLTNPGEVIIAATSASITVSDTSTIDFTGNGSSGSPLEADVKISATSDNIITTQIDGIYAGGSSLADNGMNFDTSAGRFQLGGTLTEDTTIGTGDFSLTVARIAGMANVPKIAHSGSLQITDGAATESAQLPYSGSAGYLTMSHTGNKSLFSRGIYAAMYGQTAVNSTSNITGTGHLTAVQGLSTFANTGSITNFATFKALAPRQQAAATSFSGTLTNYYGLLIADTFDSDIYAQITNKYGVYQEGDVEFNYFGGKTFFGPTYAAPTSNVDINDASGYEGLRLRNDYTPSATGDSNGQTGQITWDDSYIYVKTSAGWKRSALSTF